MLAFSQGCTVRIARCSQENPHVLCQWVKRYLLAAMAVIVMIGILIVLAHHALIDVYLHHLLHAMPQHLHLVHVAYVMLGFMLATQIFLAGRSIYTGALRGVFHPDFRTFLRGEVLV